MNILISNDQIAVDIDDRFLQFLNMIAEAVLRHEQAGGNVELSIALVDQEEIRSLNADYRGKDAPTDVLSFEVDDEDWEVQQGDPRAFRMLGDVIICPSVAVGQADEYGQTFDQEMALLLTHGILHLLGYDHVDDSDAEIMEAKEKEILSSITRQQRSQQHGSEQKSGGENDGNR